MSIKRYRYLIARVTCMKIGDSYIKRITTFSKTRTIKKRKFFKKYYRGW